MGIVELDLNRPSRQLLQTAASQVRKGGVILYPTDTIYGLGCDPFSEDALKRIFEIKQRPEKKGLLVLIPDMSWLRVLATELPRSFRLLSQRFWPGPLTFVLRSGPQVPRLLRGSPNAVGVRLPAAPFLSRLMSMIPGPIVSTSANISGSRGPASRDEMRTLLAPQVDLFLDAGELPEAVASTVVDSTVFPPRIVRDGILAVQVRQAIAHMTPE